MSYLTLYRKYRPQRFEEVVGQEPIVRTLQNAITLGKVAHAYIFSGPRGTGKTSLARIMAKALNCEKGATPSPCNQCAQCQKIRDGFAPDVIEIDAASNRGIDEIRDLRERVWFSPLEGRTKVYIIDEVHMLTSEAFNALLKILEEPPAHVVFILATTELSKVPTTILSRCQRLTFSRVPIALLVSVIERLAQEEGFKIETAAASYIARHAEGSVRDAISLLDQLGSFCQSQITVTSVLELLGASDRSSLFSLVGRMAEGDAVAAATAFNEMVDRGMHVGALARDLVLLFRDLLFVALGNTSLIEGDPSELPELGALSKQFSIPQLQDMMTRLIRTESDLRWHTHGRLVLELGLVEIVSACASQHPNTPNIPTSQHPNISALQSRWSELLTKVRTKSLPAFVCLEEGHLVEVDTQGRWVIAFKRGYSFHREHLEDQRIKAIVEGCGEEVYGSPIRITTQMTDLTPAPKSPQPSVELSASPPDLPEGQALTASDIASFFGGKVV